jgi:hypothetical protein
MRTDDNLKGFDFANAFCFSLFNSLVGFMLEIGDRLSLINACTSCALFKGWVDQSCDYYRGERIANDLFPLLQIKITLRCK